MKTPVIVRRAKNQPTPAKRLSVKLKAKKLNLPPPPAPKQIGGEDRRKGVKIMVALHSTLSGEFASRFDNVIRDNVRVKYMGQTRGREGDVRYNFTSTESDQHTQLPIHHQSVVKLQPTMSWRGSRVAARCTCRDWTYRCEVVWSKRSAALEPMTSNGEPPIRTNPTNHLFCCKHLIVIFNRLLKSNQ